MAVSSETYPQFVSAGGAPSAGGPGAERTPSRYRFGDGAFFLGPGPVREIQPLERGVLLRCAAAAQANRFVHTHETGMFQLNALPNPERSFYVEITLWAPAVVRVRFSLTGEFPQRDAGLPRECRMLTGEPEPVTWSLAEETEELELRGEALTVRVSRDPLCLRVLDAGGRERFRQCRNALFTADILDISVAGSEGEQAAFEAVTLGEDEEIYGLGERFDGVARKGRGVDFYNKDAIGTTSPRTYVNVPFYLSTKGYGLFLNSSARTEWEVGTRDAAALQFAVYDGQMDYFVMLGDQPGEILRQYCRLTGFAKLPPLWSFGLWMSRNSYTSWEMTEEIASQLREHDIPCDVLHLDTAWFSSDWNCDLRFSQERFPEPEKHLRALRNKGFHISLWQYNFIPPRADNLNYPVAAQRGYLARDGQGNPYRLPESYVGSWVDDAIVDFSNPEARAWYGAQIRGLMELGAAAIKTDFGEGIPEDAVYAGIEGRYFHNLYPLAYNYTVWQATKEATGEDIVWARSGTAGSQRYPLHWGGDSQCTFEALAGTLRAALSIGLSGIPFFSHDIGGFIGLPTPELYVRWAQFGLFSSHARCHGAGDNTYREPWRFGPEAERIFRKYAKLRYALMPYFYDQARRCTQTGLPMIRALYLAYPQDRNVRHIEDQYLLGDDLLVAPVLKPLAETDLRTLYLPAGRWTDYWTGEALESRGEWIERRVDLETMPLYVRGGAVLEYCAADTHLRDGMGAILRRETY